MLKILAASVVLAAAPLSVAAAAPSGGAAAGALPALMLVAQHGHSHGRHDDHHRRFTPGNRYGSAPHGWHSYRARPGNWRTRGCILVGPLWFCP